MVWCYRHRYHYHHHCLRTISNNKHNDNEHYSIYCCPRPPCPFLRSFVHHRPPHCVALLLSSIQSLAASYHTICTIAPRIECNISWISTPTYALSDVIPFWLEWSSMITNAWVVLWHIYEHIKLIVTPCLSCLFSRCASHLSCSYHSHANDRVVTIIFRVLCIVMSLPSTAPVATRSALHSVPKPMKHIAHALASFDVITNK